MPIDTSVEVKPLAVASNSQLPPDAPDGKWRMSGMCKNGSTQAGDPMLTITHTLVEALTPGNESYAGGNVTLKSRIMWFPKEKAGANRMNLIRLRDLCKALAISIPEPSDPNQFKWADYIQLVEAIETRTIDAWTKNKKQADGAVQTEVEYSAPQGTVTSSVPSSPAVDAELQAFNERKKAEKASKQKQA